MIRLRFGWRHPIPITEYRLARRRKFQDLMLVLPYLPHPEPRTGDTSILRVAADGSATLKRINEVYDLVNFATEVPIEMLHGHTQVFVTETKCFATWPSAEEYSTHFYYADIEMPKSTQEPQREHAKWWPGLLESGA